MSDAPERIWLDGDATIDEGVFPRCFATPKPASDPPMEFVRADIHAASIARAERAERERDRFEAALGRACLVGGTTYLLERAERAEAALAVAEEALRMIANPELSFMHEGREISENAIAKIAAMKGGEA